MTRHHDISRRQFTSFASAFAAFAGASLVAGRPAWAQSTTATLGRFGSANPQTFAAATNSFAAAFGSGVTVRDMTVNSGAQVVTAMAGGSLDVCNAGSSPIVVGFGNGVDLSMVYIEKYITDSESLVVRKGAGITTLKDLKGRRVALPFNTSVHFSMLAALDGAGMKATDVVLVNMKADSIVAAWKRSDIDAAFIWVPVLSDLAADNGEIIFTTGDLKKSGTVVFDGIAVRNAFKKERPDLVLAYLKEYDRITGIYRNDPDTVVKKMVAYLTISEATARAYVKSFHSLTAKEVASPEWMGLPGMKDTGVAHTLRKQAEFLASTQQLRQVPKSMDALIDQTFVAKMV